MSKTSPDTVLLCLVAEGLTDSGLKVHPPERHGSCRLAIACAGARCTLTINDWGDAEWEYCPCSGDNADPKQLADVTTALLTGRADDFPRLGRGYAHEGITLKGIVGLELKARGFDVDLEVYEDKDYFDARAEIVSGEEAEQGMKLLNKKYFPWRQILGFFSLFSRHKRVVFVIHPA